MVWVSKEICSFRVYDVHGYIARSDFVFAINLNYNGQFCTDLRPLGIIQGSIVKFINQSWQLKLVKTLMAVFNI